LLKPVSGKSTIHQNAISFKLVQAELSLCVAVPCLHRTFRQSRASPLLGHMDCLAASVLRPDKQYCDASYQNGFRSSLRSDLHRKNAFVGRSRFGTKYTENFTVATQSTTIAVYIVHCMIFVHCLITSLHPVVFVDVCAGVLDHQLLSAEASLWSTKVPIDRTSRSGCRQSPDASSSRARFGSHLLCSKKMQRLVVGVHHEA
jgi:hypothetical protein